MLNIVPPIMKGLVKDLKNVYICTNLLLPPIQNLTGETILSHSLETCLKRVVFFSSSWKKKAALTVVSSIQLQ
jgi:hypothetical protein